MSILDLMSQQLNQGNLKQLSAAIGADEQQTQNAISAALPALMGAMARNASSKEGAEALHGAVARDHDGSLLENLSGMLGGAAPQQGTNIVGHLLGGKQQNVEKGISASSGLSADSTSQLMAMLAPVLMGVVGRKQREGKLDAGGLSQVLGQERQELEQRSPKQMSLIGKMLDTDGDGDFDMSDIMKHGMKMFFKRD